MASTTTRRRRAANFRIHEDVPSAEKVEVADNTTLESEEQNEDDDEGRRAEEQDQQSEDSEQSDDSAIDKDVQYDMARLQDTFPGFRHKYRLIKRIGEGTFSTVYKAEDLQYHRYANEWDLDQDGKEDALDLSRCRTTRSSSTADVSGMSAVQAPARRRKPQFVAIKKIYVTSSPARILNELEILHDLKFCPAIAPLITAFRSTDQVVAILPYFKHADFREYFRKMTPRDISIYLRVLFEALVAVHSKGIIHRDIKPTNFLYNPSTRRGVLVDFGLAERQGVESKHCLCHEDSSTRKHRLRQALHQNNLPSNAYPAQDTRPSRRANRAGTRGFRAPEVLFKCTEQTTKIDIWSAGVILLTILSRRFPFFNSADDVEAMIEIATIFGSRRMKQAGQLHGCIFESTIPTIGQAGFNLEKIVMWSTCRTETGEKMPVDEREAVGFMSCCLELDPSRRINAEEALQHPFLVQAEATEDEMDMVEV